MTYGPPPAYGPPPQPMYPPHEHPQATTILVLGILGLVCCGFLGPVAVVMGRRALSEIDNSGGQIGGRSNVFIGYILGIIETVFLVAGIVITGLVIMGGIVGGSS